MESKLEASTSLGTRTAPDLSGSKLAVICESTQVDGWRLRVPQSPHARVCACTHTNYININVKESQWPLHCICLLLLLGLVCWLMDSSTGIFPGT